MITHPPTLTNFLPPHPSTYAYAYCPLVLVPYTQMNESHIHNSIHPSPPPPLTPSLPDSSPHTYFNPIHPNPPHPTPTPNHTHTTSELLPPFLSLSQPNPFPTHPNPNPILRLPSLHRAVQVPVQVPVPNLPPLLLNKVDR